MKERFGLNLKIRSWRRSSRLPVLYSVGLVCSYHGQSLPQNPAEPHSSVGSSADLRTGRWFDPRLGQYSFRALMTVIATGFISLSSLPVVSTMVRWESSQWFLKKYCAEYWLKELQESMDRCTGHHDITEIVLKTALNTIQSINSKILQC